MKSTMLAIILLAVTALAYQFGLLRSTRQGRALTREQIHSRPVYHAAWLAICCGAPGLLVLLLWSALEPWLIRNWLLASWPDLLSGPTETASVILMRRLKSWLPGLTMQPPWNWLQHNSSTSCKPGPPWAKPHWLPWLAPAG